MIRLSPERLAELEGFGAGSRSSIPTVDEERELIRGYRESLREPEVFVMKAATCDVGGAVLTLTPGDRVFVRRTGSSCPHGGKLGDFCEKCREAWSKIRVEAKGRAYAGSGAGAGTIPVAALDKVGDWKAFALDLGDAFIRQLQDRLNLAERRERAWRRAAYNFRAVVGAAPHDFAMQVARQAHESFREAVKLDEAGE